MDAAQACSAALAINKMFSRVSADRAAVFIFTISRGVPKLINISSPDRSLFLACFSSST